MQPSASEPGGQVPAADAAGMPVVVARTRRARQARDWQLVLAAAGIQHDLSEQTGEAALIVPGEQAEHAARELALFEQENRGWPRADELPEVLTQGSLGVAVWVVLLFVVDQLARHDALGHDWFASGRSAAGAIRAGQWWRAVTALTLHADLYHLLGNVAFGALFVGLVSQVLGTGTALLATLAAGTIGNLANAWIQDPAHASIGASTAVFGALGILVGYRARHRPRTARGRSRRWIPILAGVILLGYLGTGGATPETARIDVAAHVLGFSSGGLVGVMWTRKDGWRPGSRAQLALGCSAGLAVLLAWVLAVR